MSIDAPLVSDPDPADAARLLDIHPDYRVLRRLGDAAHLAVDAGANVDTRVAAIVDVETTGLVSATDRIIELAVQRIRFTGAGQITQVGVARSWREDPEVQLDPAISKLTGLTEADLAGQAIDDDEATAMLTSADVIIAHNAAFDAKFVEARLPAAAGLAWACSLTEVDWAEHGFAGRQLGCLLMEAGYFFAGHRAEQDVLATIHLMAHQTPTGASILAHLITRAEQRSIRLEAVGAPFASKDLLKARGYRWDAQARFWWTEVPETAASAEILWLRENVGEEPPKQRQVTWRERHR